MNAENSPALARLERSRAALASRMRGNDAQDPAPTATVASPDALPGVTSARPRTHGKWSKAKRVIGVWWRRHPASLAAEIAQPAVAQYARNNPMKLLGYAAAAGAAIVVIKPWRIVPVTAVVAMLLKTSDVAAVTAAMISPKNDNPTKE